MDRPRSTSLIAFAAALLAVVVALIGASGAGSARPASASAVAFARDTDGARTGLVRARGDGSDSTARTSVSASTSGRRGAATARATSGRVSLFGGLVTARSVEVDASARGASSSVGGRVAGLRVDGKSYGSPTTSRRLSMGGHGTLTVLGRRGGGIAGLRARLSEAYEGQPAGTTVTVAFAAASARNGTAPAAKRKTAKPGPREAGRPDRVESDSGRPAPRRRAPKAKRRRAPKLDPSLTGRRYVFPVYGKVSYTNDWGAPRQHTGTHEGNDIFAPTGAPVLAVTDGTLSRVGTRPIPGNRLYLENEEGDVFFYGHLQAFAEDARNGAKVKAGDVIGFNGSTGDAEQTPPHVHFEVMPGGGDSVNPYPFLRAWQDRRDVPRATWLERYGDDPGSRPGALVVLDDYLEP